MDTTSLLPVIAGGAIALASQMVGANRNRRVAQMQIDYERWEGWRREAADVWAKVMLATRDLDQSFEDLADSGEEELARIRTEAGVAVQSLDRLSALTLDHRVAEWSAQLAGQLVEAAAALPAHPFCDDELAVEQFQQRRHILHSPFDWNDGSQTTQLERLRDVLRRSANPPDRTRTFRGASLRRARARRRLRRSL